jgi:uncharacterized membrane protein
LSHIVLLEQLFAEAKVCQLYDPIIEEDVGRLEVPVQDVSFIEGGKGQPQLLEYLQSLLFGQPAFLLDEFCECPSIAELIDEVVVIGGSQHFYELDDVGMGHLAEDADLVVGELRQLGRRLELVRVHHLHRVQLLRRLVLRLIDVAVLPSTDLLLQDVVLDHLVHALLILSMVESMNGEVVYLR